MWHMVCSLECYSLELMRKSIRPLRTTCRDEAYIVLAPVTWPNPSPRLAGGRAVASNREAEKWARWAGSWSPRKQCMRLAMRVRMTPAIEDDSSAMVSSRDTWTRKIYTWNYTMKNYATGPHKVKSQIKLSYLEQQSTQNLAGNVANSFHNNFLWLITYEICWSHMISGWIIDKYTVE